MNRKRISLYIYTLLIVVGTNTALDSSKIMAYSNSIMSVNNVDGKMTLQESKVSNIEAYTIDASNRY